MTVKSKVVVDFQFYYIKCIKFFKIIFLDFRVLSCQYSLKENLQILLSDILYFLLTLNASIFFGLSTYKLFVGSSDVKNLIFAFSSTISTLRYILRILWTFHKKMELADVLDIMKKSYNQETVDKYQIGNSIKNFRMMKSFTKMIGVGGTVFLNFGPLVKLLFYFQISFPVDSPFEAENINIYLYPLAYFWTFFSYSYIILSNGLFDFVLYSFIIVTSIEFQILSLDFKHLKIDQITMQEEIKSLINRHNELFIIRNKLEEIFSFPLLCTYISNSLNACFTAFYATISIGSTDMIEQAFFSFASFLLILSQCFFGQMLKDASESVVNGIYECGWEDIKDIQIRRAFISIIQRSQKPECLTIMKFGDVTLKQFTTASDEQIFPKELSNKIIFT